VDVMCDIKVPRTPQDRLEKKLEYPALNSKIAEKLIDRVEFVDRLHHQPRKRLREARSTGWAFRN